jgi:hypothetical protein
MIFKFWVSFLLMWTYINSNLNIVVFDNIKFYSYNEWMNKTFTAYVYTNMKLQHWNKMENTNPHINYLLSTFLKKLSAIISSSPTAYIASCLLVSLSLSIIIYSSSLFITSFTFYPLN